MSPVTQAPATTNRQDDLGSAGGVRGLLWLTWRQHRWSLIGMLVLAAVLVGWMTYLSVELTGLWHQCHDTFCPENSPQGERLAGSSSLVLTLGALSRLVQYMPLLIGVFIGVPVLSREHEQRTLLLAWSQDVSPARWLWTKLSLLGLFVTAVTAAVAGVSDHLERMKTLVAPGNLFDYVPFLNTGMLPVAISIGWFAVGVALGAAIRRTLPAAFGVIAGFIGLMLGVQWRYPTLTTPLSYYQQIGQPPGSHVSDPNVLVVNGLIDIRPDSVSNVFDSPGHEVTYADLQRICPNLSLDPHPIDCLARNDLLTYVTYQPSSRIPAFHLIIASGYLGLAAVALAAVWLLVRRTNLSAG
jgi:hypothetical protein